MSVAVGVHINYFKTVLIVRFKKAAHLFLITAVLPDNHTVFDIVTSADNLVKAEPLCNIRQKKIGACTDNNTVSRSVEKPFMYTVDMLIPKLFYSLLNRYQRNERKAGLFELRKIYHADKH